MTTRTLNLSPVIWLSLWLLIATLIVIQCTSRLLTKWNMSELNILFSRNIRWKNNSPINL